MIVAQVTAITGKCPHCGHDDVRLVDIIQTKTNRTLEVVCEDCMEETGH